MNDVCPVCKKTFAGPMNLAKHVVSAVYKEEEHRAWIKERNLNLSEGFKPLADLFASKQEV